MIVWLYVCGWLWRRSVVKSGGQGHSDWAIKLFQAARKINLTFRFYTSLSFLMMWSLQSYPTTVLNKRMWHFRGAKIFWPLLHIFRGQDSPAPRIYSSVDTICQSRRLCLSASAFLGTGWQTCANVPSIFTILAQIDQLVIK